MRTRVNRWANSNRIHLTRFLVYVKTNRTNTIAVPQAKLFSSLGREMAVAGLKILYRLITPRKGDFRLCHKFCLQSHLGHQVEWFNRLAWHSINFHCIQIYTKQFMFFLGNNYDQEDPLYSLISAKHNNPSSTDCCQQKYSSAITNFLVKSP